MKVSFPAEWPSDRPETPKNRRKSSSLFRVTESAAVSHLRDEIHRLGGKDAFLTKDYAESNSVRAVVKFNYDGEARVFACDSYDTLRANVRAIGLTIEALRSIERHGASEMLKQALTGFLALPPASKVPAAAGKGPAPVARKRPWFEVLGLFPTAPLAVAEAAYRELAKISHPDNGGSTEAMTELNVAIEEAREAKK